MDGDMTIPKELRFRVSPRTMQMLGRENVSSPVIGVLELVKNAYDADATNVTITFRRASTSEGEIIIADDGDGMTLGDLQEKWMVISTDDKRRNPTTRKGRTKVGEKGIGRLALDRLCKQAIITTRREGNDTGLKLELDWTKYDSEDGELQEIAHPLSEVAVQSEGTSGTELHLKSLRDRWTMRDYEKLYIDLSLLVSPFDDTFDGFVVHLDCDEAPDYSGRVTNSVAGAYEFKLEARLDEDGHIALTLTHRSGETIEENKQWDEFSDIPEGGKPSCGALSFTMYFYLREPAVLKELGISRADMDRFLDQFQGIRIYRDNFRVHPYGDPHGENDWLGLNWRQVRSPAGPGRPNWVVGGHQVVGGIFITRQDNPNLQDQTNREGLSENNAFYDMRRFVMDSINFFERERRAHYQRSQETPQTEEKPVQVATALTGVHDELNTLATDLREVTASISSQPLFTTEETSSLRQLTARIEQVQEQVKQSIAIATEEQTERQLLLGLATLGIAMTAFGHETTRAVNTLLGQAELLKDALPQLPNDVRLKAVEDLQVLVKAAERVEAWGKFALDRIRRDKRTQKDIHVNTIIEDVLGTFAGIINLRSIIIRKEKLSPDLVPLRAFAMDIEAIIINLLTNAIEAMRHTPLERRVIQLETYSTALNGTNELVLCVTDGGRGIKPEQKKKIFDPLYSTRVDKANKPIGTGMGLTIVRDVVKTYQGRIDVEGFSDLGGAQFRIILPYRSKRG